VEAEGAALYRLAVANGREAAEDEDEDDDEVDVWD
jgi:hypothetical protein